MRIYTLGDVDYTEPEKKYVSIFYAKKLCRMSIFFWFKKAMLTYYVLQNENIKKDRI